jgi:hypothetical protein
LMLEMLLLRMNGGKVMKWECSVAAICKKY